MRFVKAAVKKGDEVEPTLIKPFKKAKDSVNGGRVKWKRVRRALPNLWVPVRRHPWRQKCVNCPRGSRNSSIRAAAEPGAIASAFVGYARLGEGDLPSDISRAWLPVAPQYPLYASETA